MAAAATIGLNANLLIGTTTASTQATAIGQVLSCNPSFDADEVDVTPITSTGHRAYIAGPRSATLAFELAYDHTDTQHLLLATNWSAGSTNYYHLELPGDIGTSNTNNWTMRGFITSLAPTIDPSDKHGASVTVRLTEAPTLL